MDITNRTIDEINELIGKYASVLELLKTQHQPYLAVIIDVGVKYIKENYKNLELDWKAWSIVYLKNKYIKGKLKKESDIPGLIDDFIQHYKDKYADYIKQLGIYSTEFDRDYGFVCAYL